MNRNSFYVYLQWRTCSLLPASWLARSCLSCSENVAAYLQQHSALISVAHHRRHCTHSLARTAPLHVPPRMDGSSVSRTASLLQQYHAADATPATPPSRFTQLAATARSIAPRMDERRRTLHIPREQSRRKRHLAQASRHAAGYSAVRQCHKLAPHLAPATTPTTRTTNACCHPHIPLSECVFYMLATHTTHA